MFNVSALLLDDALKPATPLTMAPSVKRCDISQGSVATHLRCGGIFSNRGLVLLQIFYSYWQWNNVENRLIFDEVKAYENGAIFGLPCMW